MGEFSAEAEQVNRSNDDAAPAMAKHCRKAWRNPLFFERLALLEISSRKPGERRQRTKAAVKSMLGKALRIGSGVS